MENVFPSDLSDEQQQRIALVCAIVTNPKVKLLGEPLSNLDPKLRESMRFEIKRLQKEFNFTIIFVTHDKSKAMALSDRMLVMDIDNVVQIGTPTELYNKPTSRFVHSFLGQSNSPMLISWMDESIPKATIVSLWAFQLPLKTRPRWCWPPVLIRLTSIMRKGLKPWCSSVRF